MSSRVHSDDLFGFALLRPRTSETFPDELKIVSGYASPSMAVTHLLEIGSISRRIRKPLPTSIDLVYGMTGADGVSKENHLSFTSLARRREFSYDGSFSCSYVRKPKSIHSKVYVWCRDGVPVKAYVGSANYSQQAFFSSCRTESLCECDPESALSLFESAKKSSIDCLDADIEEEFRLRHKQSPARPESAIVKIEDDVRSEYFGREKLVLSLLTRKKNVGDGSCLNWGVRSDGRPRSSGAQLREPNQAYIGIPSVVQKSGFFPERPYRFSVKTDDDRILSCVRAQDNGKAIETPQDNSELGRYFRQRLGLGSGAYITVEDLKRYGRMDVVFYKLSDDSFAMDFSKKQNDRDSRTGSLPCLQT